MNEDRKKLGYKEMILRCDGEPALKSCSGGGQGGEELSADRGKLASGRQSRNWSGRASCPNS